MNCSKHAAIHFSVCTTCKIDLYLPRYRNGAGGERAWSHSEPAIDGRILLSDTRLAELAGGSYFMQLRWQGLRHAVEGDQLGILCRTRFKYCDAVDSHFTMIDAMNAVQCNDASINARMQFNGYIWCNLCTAKRCSVATTWDAWIIDAMQLHRLQGYNGGYRGTCSVPVHKLVTSGNVTKWYDLITLSCPYNPFMPIMSAYLWQLVLHAVFLKMVWLSPEPADPLVAVNHHQCNGSYILQQSGGSTDDSPSSMFDNGMTLASSALTLNTLHYFAQRSVKQNQ